MAIHMFTDQQRNRKLAVLGAVRMLGGYKTVAAKAVGVNPRTLYKWVDADPEFAKALDEVVLEGKEQYCYEVEKEAFDRAVNGWEEPVFYKGHICGHIRKKSDRVLIKLLEGANPAKYNTSVQKTQFLDKQGNETDAPGGAQVILLPAIASRDEWATVAQQAQDIQAVNKQKAKEIANL